MTDRYAVFGNPIAHSKSPLIHAAFARQTGQDMAYEARLAPLEGFARAVREFAQAGGRGANVTVPFKEEAFRLCDRLAPRAQAAGAVNTLSFEPDGIRGDNTDGAGLVRDIVHNLGLPLADRRVLIVGAGGAARGVILPVLEQRPAALTVSNRNPERALRLREEFAAGGSAFEACGFDALAGRRFDVVINATSAGLDGAAPALPDGVFAPQALAYDMVYGKGVTAFMAAALAAGCGRAADGLGMLVEQAAEAFLIWRGIRPDTAPVLAALRGA